MTRGFGGSAISREYAFKCYNIVRPNTGAFKLLDHDIQLDPETPATDLEVVLESKKQGLMRLFQERKASPGDVDENGDTLMHVSLWHRCLCS